MADNYNDQDLYGNYQYTEGEVPASLSALEAIIRNLRVTSAMIENAAIIDAHIQSVGAGKITAGQLLIDSNNIAFNASWKSNVDGWSLLGGAFRDTGAPFDDTLAVKVDKSGLATPSYSGVKQTDSYRIKCTQGEWFTGSIYYYVSDLSLFDGNVGLELEWYDANGNRIGVSSFVERPTHTSYYKRVSVTGQAPAGAAKVGIYAWLEKNGRVWFAKPQLQSGKFLTEWTSNGTYIGPNGIMTSDIIFSGKLQGATGTFSGALSAATGNFAGELTTVSGTMKFLKLLGEWGGQLTVGTGYWSSGGSVWNPTGDVVFGNDPNNFANRHVQLSSGSGDVLLDVKGTIGASIGYDRLGKKVAYSWYGTINSGSYIDLVHNLGYYPIFSLGGSTTNLQLLTGFVNINTVRVYNYSSGGNAWTGSAHLY